MGGSTNQAEARAATRQRPFVGRERELGELTSALAEAAGGHPVLVLVSGEPGIGKSRLAEELAGHASGTGWRVLSGRGWDGGGAPAYWPWVQVVRAAGGDFERLAAIEHEEGRPGSDRSVAPGSVDPEAARFRLFDRVERFLCEAAEERPCLIVLDDLHAADEPSLLLLRFLATTAVGPMMVVGTYRENELRVHELADLFGELARVCRRIPLPGLSPEEIARYVSLIAGDATPASVAARIHDVTGGNPLFVGEAVRVLLGEGRLGGSRDGAIRLPEEVRALIRRRVAGLSTEAISILRVAAVVGREFDIRAVAPTSTLSLERLVDVLGEAVRDGVISELGDSPTRYGFAHDLVRETLYDDIAAARRMELHRTVGGVLEELFRDDLEPHLAEIAHHLAQAAPLGEAGRAVEYAERAGDRARALLAYEDAARLYSSGLQLLASGEGAAERRCELLLRLGDVQSRSGDTEDARTSFEEAAEIARRAGRPDLLSEAALGFSTVVEPVRLGLGGLLITSAHEVGATGIVLLEEALRALGDGDGPMKARTLARLATELYNTDETERRLALSREALDMAMRLGSAPALVTALHGRHWATLGPDTIHERLENAQQMLLAATAAGDDEAVFLARQTRLHCFLELCDLAGLDAELEAMTALATRIRQPFYVWHAACLRSMRALLAGRIGEAERLVPEALSIPGFRETEYVTYMVEYAQMAAIRWMQGRLGDVGDRIREHSDRYPGIARWRDALLAAEVGDETAAREEVERHAADGFARLPRDGLWILHLCTLAQASVVIRDESRAAALYDLLRPYEDRNAISVSTMPFGPVALRLGMLATLLERWDDADGHFATALERCAALGARGMRAVTLQELARMCLRRGGRGDEERARAALGESIAICDDLEMPGFRGRAAEIEATLVRRPATPSDAANAMFRREGDYFTVAYRGELARVRDLKGLRYLAALLGAPGREVHVLELVAAAEGHRADDRAGVGADDLAASRADRAGPVLDATAKHAYRRRLRELAEDLEQARSWNDPEREAGIRLEIDALTTELERALGLGGGDRGLPSNAERARISVTKAIGVAIRAVSRDCPKLGEHLAASVRTGRLCSYAPPAQEAPTWRL